MRRRRTYRLGCDTLALPQIIMTKQDKQIIEEFRELYPLQKWSEKNPDQAIIINPTLQKTHRDKLESFILSALSRRDKEIKEELEIEHLKELETQLKEQREDIIKEIEKVPINYDVEIAGLVSKQDIIKIIKEIKVIMLENHTPFGSPEEWLNGAERSAKKIVNLLSQREKESYEKGFADGLCSETIQRDEYTAQKVKETKEKIIKMIEDFSDSREYETNEEYLACEKMVDDIIKIINHSTPKK